METAHGRWIESAEMATGKPRPGVGAVLRQWRERRRLSQLELALGAGISARHLSFIETGRSKPGRDALLRILGRLEVPLREQNRLLITAGHAPAFPERPLEELAPVRQALDLILAGHEPYPAIVVDRGWNLVATNGAMWALTVGVEVDPLLLEPPVNVLRVGLHPKGLAPLIVDYAAWRAFVVERLERQLAMTGDDDLAALVEEVAGYPVPEQEHSAASSPVTGDVLGPLRLRAPDGSGELSFFGMFATFDAPFDVTTSELALELLFPADRETAEILETLGRDHRESRAPEASPIRR
jgi:transcriptional regulator with XRE-family HTH domain